MKDIMKYYLQLITLVFCLFVSACSDDDETTTPVFPDLQKIECEIGDTKTLTFEAADNWILTSSSLWCYFEQDGVTYHHIIDPKTGYPAENGLVSVTIVSSDGTLADGLSTSLFIMGEEKAAEFWKAHSDEFEAILETDDETIYVTEGLKDSFTTDLDMKVITK